MRRAFFEQTAARGTDCATFLLAPAAAFQVRIGIEQSTFDKVDLRFERAVRLLHVICLVLGLFLHFSTHVRRVLKCWFRGCRLATGDLHSALIEQCRTVPVQRNHRAALVGDVVVERVLDAGGGLRIDEQTVVLVEMLR